MYVPWPLAIVIGVLIVIGLVRTSPDKRIEELSERIDALESDKSGRHNRNDLESQSEREKRW